MFLLLTNETPNGSGELAFLDLNVHNDRKNSCHWYQKLTDTGIVLDLRRCAALQHKKNVL